MTPQGPLGTTPQGSHWEALLSQVSHTRCGIAGRRRGRQYVGLRLGLKVEAAEVNVVRGVGRLCALVRVGKSERVVNEKTGGASPMRDTCLE
jgi:hypothetical protein